MKIYLIIKGEKVKAYGSLRRLCTDTNGLDYDFVSKNLPFETGSLKITEVEMDMKL